MSLTRTWRCALGLLALFLLGGGTGAAPATAADPFLAQLAGSWELPGSVRGQPVHHRAHGRWVLNAGWLCLSLTDTATPPAYQAEVYLGFDPQQHDYIVHWLDQFGAAGARVVGRGQRRGQQLVLLFPYQEGAFRDTLTLATDGHSGTLLLESQKADGHWATFASYQMQRSGPAAAPPAAR